MITGESDNFNEVWKQLISQNEIICAEKKLEKWISIDDMNQLNLANTVSDDKI